MTQDSNSPGENWDDIFGGNAERGAQAEHAPPEQAPLEHAPPLSRREARQAQDSQGRARRERPARRDKAASYDSDRGGPKKRRGRGWIIALAILLVILGGAAGGAAWAWTNYEDQVRKVMGWEIPIDYEGGGHGEASIIIRSGDGGAEIAGALADAGVTKTTEAFYKLLLKQDPQVVFFPGHYQLKLEMSAQAALDALQDPANKLEISVRIPEGSNLTRAMSILAEGTGIDREEFEAAIADPSQFDVPAEAPSLEGYLFPAVYTFEPDDDAVSVINTLVARTFQSLDAAGAPVEDRHRVLTIASLIQREAGPVKEDFYKVSRVIQNRLDKGMRLEFDSTVHYGYAWHHGERERESIFSTKAELNDDNPYNTYLHTGLPIGPIGASQDTAIDAAMNPVKGDWLFFVAVNFDTGETKFTNTNAQHEAAVAEMQKWCRDTQSPKCD